MKRRSARPFVVEVKHTRTSKASLAPASFAQASLVHVIDRAGPAADPWLTPSPSLPIDRRVRAPVTPSPVIERQEPPVPERRILPCLVPMFAPQSEPDAPTASHAPRPPRSRPPKAEVPPDAAAAGQVVSNAAARRRPATTKMEPVAPDAVPAARVVARAEDRPLPSPRRTAGLRPGERWKRRLPRVLW